MEKIKKFIVPVLVIQLVVWMYRFTDIIPSNFNYFVLFFYFLVFVFFGVFVFRKVKENFISVLIYNAILLAIITIIDLITLVIMDAGLPLAKFLVFLYLAIYAYFGMAVIAVMGTVVAYLIGKHFIKSKTDTI